MENEKCFLCKKINESVISNFFNCRLCLNPVCNECDVSGTAEKSNFIVLRDFGIICKKCFNKKTLLPKELIERFNAHLEAYFRTHKHVFLKELGEILLAIYNMTNPEDRQKIYNKGVDRFDLSVAIQILTRPEVIRAVYKSGQEVIRTYANYGSAPQRIINYALIIGTELKILRKASKKAIENLEETIGISDEPSEEDDLELEPSLELIKK